MGAEQVALLREIPAAPAAVGVMAARVGLVTRQAQALHRDQTAAAPLVAPPVMAAVEAAGHLRSAEMEPRQQGQAAALAQLQQFLAVP